MAFTYPGLKHLFWTYLYCIYLEFSCLKWKIEKLNLLNIQNLQWINIQKMDKQCLKWNYLVSFIISFKFELFCIDRFMLWPAEIFGTGIDQSSKHFEVYVWYECVTDSSCWTIMYLSRLNWIKFIQNSISTNTFCIIFLNNFCLILLHVPKCFGLVQISCARPKIYSYIVTVTNIMCQTKRWFAFSKIDFSAGTKVFEEALNVVKFLGGL